MKSILFTSISRKNELYEQVFSLINSILMAKKSNKKVIVVDSFNSENIPIPFCEVFDLSGLNNLLKQHDIDIIVVDKTFIDYKINAVLYNQNNKIVDMTEKTKPNGQIYPEENVSQVFINYTINKKTISDTYLQTNITTDIHKQPYQYSEPVLSKDNLFDVLIKGIDFKPYLKKGQSFDNIIHINVEYEKYRGNNNLEQYKNRLDETYIHLINEFMKKDETILLIGREENERVIDFLKKNEYNFEVDILTDSFKEIEVLHSECKIFVGNFDLENLKGNPYSYYLSKKIKCQKKIMIDLYNL